jgi:outer membrane protein assembly factor BamA
MRLGVVLLALVALGLAASGAHAQVIGEIVIDENTKTTDDTVRYLARVREGDRFSPDDVAGIELALIDSGLFKEVQVFYDVIGTAQDEEVVRVTILVKDRHSWAVAPTFFFQPTNRGAGFGYGETNLFGENKKLIVYGQIATGDSMFIAGYRDPQVGNTPLLWQAELWLRRAREFEYAPPASLLTDSRRVRETRMNFLRAGARFGYTLFRSASLNWRLRGGYVFFTDTRLVEGAEVSDITDDPAVTPDDIPHPGVRGWDVWSRYDLQFDRRANYYGIVTGNYLGIQYKHGLPALGSDFDYWLAGVETAVAREPIRTHNLVLRSSVELGRDLPFHHERTSGGMRLRGYPNDQFRGDFKAAANLEYSLPIFTIRGFSLRALGFVDSSYTAFLDIEETDEFRHYLPGHGERGRHGLAPFKNSVGLGSRLFWRQVALPLLGLDFGYGLESGALEVYFALGITD